MKILLTGANSFVGKNLMLQSRYKEIDEISLVDNNPNEIDFTIYNVIVHVAAIVHQSKKIPESEYFRVNRDLCIDVANLQKKVVYINLFFLVQ